MKYALSASYGNDSIALIQWAHEQGLVDVVVVYCDTGWAAPGWDKRVAQGEEFARRCGFTTHRLKSMGMEELVRMKKGFPSNQYQFCTAYLKGLPFLNWIDEQDPDLKTVVMVGKRRLESKKRATTEEYVWNSEYHGGRVLWHPLYAHSKGERNALLKRAGFEELPHRSQECSPCVNANRNDFLALEPVQIERVNALEVEIGKPMYRPGRYCALGIFGVMTWAKFGRTIKRMRDVEDNEEGSGCDGAYGCGL